MIGGFKESYGRRFMEMAEQHGEIEMKKAPPWERKVRGKRRVQAYKILSNRG